MTQQDFGPAWMRGRRGYIGAAMAVLVLVVLVVARFASPAEVAVAETAAPNEALPVVVDTTPAVDSAAIADSIAAADSAAGPSIVMADASPEELFDFPPITDGVPRMRRPAVV